MSTRPSQAEEPAAVSGTVTIVPSTIEYMPPLAKAILLGDKARIDEELKDDKYINAPILAKKGKRAGFTPIILAAALSDKDTVRKLVEHGAKITDLDDYNRSVFWYAAMNEDVNIAAMMLKAPGVTDVINVADNVFLRTPLHLAIRSDSLEMVKLLLSHGADKSLYQKDVLRETPRDFCEEYSNDACNALPR
jgi:ankyrin repeat protein